MTTTRVKLGGTALLAVALATILATVVFAATRYRIVVEAEHYNSIKASMTAKGGDSTASSGKYVEYPLKRPHAQAENSAIKGDGGHATFKVKVPEQGNYLVYVRSWWYDACGNSFFLVVDDKPAQIVGGDGTLQTWKWRKAPRAYALTAGVHTIKLQNREDGARADEILVTNDTRTTPTGRMAETPAYLVAND